MSVDVHRVAGVEAVGSITLTEAIEVIACTDVAAANLDGAAWS